MKYTRRPYPSEPREFKIVLNINYVLIILNVLGGILVAFLDNDVLNAGGGFIFALIVFYYNNKFNKLEYYVIDRLKILYMIMIFAYCISLLLLDRPSAIIWLVFVLIQYYTVKSQEIGQYFIDYRNRISQRETLNIHKKGL
ncbi:MAG: hypothetical protein HeimC2_11650 [Candidatus Heimdallarchaeota archaeon LC_2]|nr:MAG: hypothetical protein HeimC2_11650 [Candidatus Heimdallarchaeota archaeon LC_2]